MSTICRGLLTNSTRVAWKLKFLLLRIYRYQADWWQNVTRTVKFCTISVSCDQLVYVVAFTNYFHLGGILEFLYIHSSNQLFIVMDHEVLY